MTEERAAVGSDGQDREPEPPCADPIAGELVEQPFAYDGGRRVTAYVPADPPEAVVFAGDGQLVSRWGGYLEAAGLPPTVIVGAHRSGDGETVRIAEYSPSFDEARFAAHESFFVDDVRGVAAGIAATAPISSRYTKVALADGGHRDFETALRWEALAQPATLATADLQEGVRAAREKRTPVFTGE